MFTLVKENWYSAFVYALLIAVIDILAYVISLGDVFKIDSHELINVGVLSLAVGLSSLLKNLLTTNSGKFAGVIPVIPDKAD